MTALPTATSNTCSRLSFVASARARDRFARCLLVYTGVVSGLLGVPAFAGAQGNPPSVQSQTVNAVVQTAFSTFEVVTNNDNVAETYRLALTCPPELIGCAIGAPITRTIGGHTPTYYSIGFTPTAPGTFRISVVANNDSSTVSGSGTITVNVPGGVPQITVGPKSSPSISQPQNTSNITQSFTVSTVTGSPTTSYVLTPSCVYPVISCTSQSTVSVTGGTPMTVTVNYATASGPNSAGSVSLTATNSPASDFATVPITVTAPSFGVTIVPATGNYTVQQPANASGQMTTFRVTNTGGAATYNLGLQCTGLVPCSLDFATTGPVSVGGTFYATASYTTGGFSSQGSVQVTASGNGITPVSSTVTINTPPPPPPPPQVVVTPDAQPYNLNQGATAPLSFTVSNPGPNQTTYTVVVSCSASITCSTPSTPLTLGPAGSPTASSTFPIQVTAGATTTGTYPVTVTATATSNASVADNGSYSVTIVVPQVATVGVSPHAATVNVNPNVMRTSTFTVTNTHPTANGTFNYTLTCPATVVINCSITTPLNGGLTGSTSQLTPQALFGVTITYTAKATAGLTGTLKLVAVNSISPATKDSGQITITTVALSPITVASHMQGLNGSIAREACLDMALGKGASYECGDIRAAYAFPAMTTMNRTRQPTLMFVSSHANATAIIEADITMDVGMTPSQIVPTLKVNGVTQSGIGPITWDPTWPTNVPRRITLPIDGSALPLPTGGSAGTYQYWLQIAATVAGVTKQNADSGLVTIVNRVNSPFGRGWWLEGYEQVLTPIDTSTRLWVGGDGSSRLYTRTVPNGTTWTLSPMLDRPDTLTLAAGVYQRHLPNGAFTEFNASGQHLRTVSALADTTTFTYAAGLLDTIKLAMPTASPGPKYQLRYATFTGLPSRLSEVHLFGPGVVDRTTFISVTNGMVGSFRFLPLTDTASVKTQYDYNPAATVNAPTSDLAKITDPLNRITQFTYDLGKLRQSTVVMAAAADNIINTFCPAETRSRSYCSTLPEPLSRATTIIDGPRPGSADTSVFLVNRFGAPDDFENALGMHTRFVRSATFPLLATSIIDPNGLTTNVALNFRGLPDTTTVVNPLGAGTGNAITSYTWHGKWNHPLTVKTPTSEVTTFTYDGTKPLRLTQFDGRATARFHYDARARVDSIIPPSNGNPTVGGIAIGYDASLGNYATTASWRGTTETLTRDAIGRVTNRATPISSIAVRNDSTTYYASGQAFQEISTAPVLNGARAESLTVTHVYDKTGLVLSLLRGISNDVRGPNPPALRTSWTYDSAGRKRTEQAPDGKIEQTTYDPAGNTLTFSPRPRAEFLGSISMTYDVLNRMKSRIVPKVSYVQKISAMQSLDFAPGGSYLGGTITKGTFVQDTFYRTPYPQYANATQNGYDTPADTATFVYSDTTNALLSANNVDARVSRSYFPNGLTRTETQQLATRDRTNFALHTYTLSNQYDMSGRRIELYHPAALRAGSVRDRTSWTYDLLTGAMATVTDVQGNRVSYAYHPDGALKSITHGDASGISETMDYDPDGRLLTGYVFNASSSPTKWQVTNSSATLRAESYTFDTRDKLTSVGNFGGFLNQRTMKYSGLGYLVYSYFNTETPLWAGATDSSAITESFATDGLGNADTSTTTHAGNLSTGPAYSSWWLTRVPNPKQYYDPSLRQVRAWYAPTGRIDSLVYDGAGNREWIYQKLLAAAPDRTRDERRSFYGADGKLRADDHRRLVDNTKTYTAVFEEYRYDALGRRTWVESRQYCQGGNDANPLCRFSKMRRVIWDGSQELYEIQMPDSTVDGFDARENDTGLVPRMLPFADPNPITNALQIDPNRLFGRVAYTYGLGVDAPVSVARFGYASTTDRNGWQTWAPTTYATIIRDSVFAILPIWNYQGKAEIGVFADGGATRCVTTPRSNCIDIFWPRMFSAYRQEIGYGIRTAWHGSLLEDKQDASGLLYRRNRMYDPASGRFTQEDPIGLAGGMNLYGFGGGGPVNFSDPFGLCPEDMGGDGKTKGNKDCPKDSKGWNQYRSGAVASAGWADPFLFIGGLVLLG